MKNLIIGSGLLIFSAIIYGSSMVTASIYSQVLSKDGGPGWDGRYGIFGTALIETGMFSLIVAGAAGITGIMLIINSLKSK